MNRRKFPLLTELALCAGTSLQSLRCLTSFQSEAQEELRSQRRDFDLGPGIIYPFPERRAMTATGTTATTGDQGGMTIATDVPEIGHVFLDSLVLPKLGARVLAGLTANPNLPATSAAVTASWLSETAQASDTATTFASFNMQPHRVIACLPISTQLLIQNPGIESFLVLELMSRLAAEAQRVTIVGTGASNQPLGIINTTGIGSVVGGANGAAPTYANLCDLEYAVTGTAKADRGYVGWMASPLTRKKLRNTFVNGTGSDPVWDSDDAYSLLGHPAGVTTGVPDNLTKGNSSLCSAIICGEFSELFVGLFGPGIVVDAVSSVAQAKLGQTTLFASAYVDSGVRIPSAFAAMQDALCN